MTKTSNGLSGVIPPVIEPSHAVFLSYASQDQAAAQRICDALRAAGMEVWFDQSALRGGDVWDQAIRKQIKTCVLFIPVISRHTHDRDEGYFRLEWKLAVDRSHLMTSNKAFLLPVVIDETREDDENVPDRFKDIHWTRLPAGETPATFVERVRRLVSPEPSRGPTEPPLSAGPPRSAATPPIGERAPGSSRSKRALAAIVGVVVAGTLAYFAIDRFWVVKRQASPSTPPAASANIAPTAFAPPPHSIAVLPFVNMSGDSQQDYFSDGLSEELLNSLSRITALQVAARTSSFSFKGKQVDIADIAHKLNVGAILEGSVRKAGTQVRITAQLINAVTGFHLWSQTYDRDLRHVLALQTEIASAVTTALQATLLGDSSALIELGGTQNPLAFDAYLSGQKFAGTTLDKEARLAQLAAYSEAIRLDPRYAKAYVAKALLMNDLTTEETGPAVRERYKEASAAAEKALVLAPELGEAHAALAVVLEDGFLDYARAALEFDRALALSPGNTVVLIGSAYFFSSMGRTEAAVANARRLVVLDPLNVVAHRTLGRVLHFARRDREAIEVYNRALSLNPHARQVPALRGVAYLSLGELEAARASCAMPPIDWMSNMCLAIVYHKVNRQSDADAELAVAGAAMGDEGAFLYAEIYAQWGNIAKALEWLETAYRMHDSGLEDLKVDPILDPLRQEPRFQAIERELKFPN